MNTKLMIAILGALAVLFLAAWQQPAAPAPPLGASGVRVGTFQRTDVLVTYYRSPIHDRFLQSLQAERDQAAAAGNEKRIKEIEAQGGAAQDLAHRQLAGQATLENIFDHLRQDFPQIAAEAGVQVLVEQPLYIDPAVKTVDVTDLIVKRFGTAEAPGSGK